ncbi:MAG: CBS domain-containing protein [Rhodospirillales bacterium]|nr:CBS domain-containing protein [Rhodospirillales bacterium]
MSESHNQGVAWLQNLAKRLQDELDAGAAPQPETLTVRQFLANFGYARRRGRVVGEIRENLAFYGLQASPDFELQYIDSPITVELKVDITETEDNRLENDPTVRVGILDAAHNSPVRVAPDDLLVKATTLMQMEDYSQLPVMTTDRTVKGIVSWQSIGEAYARGSFPKTVKECMEEAYEVDENMPLASAANVICDQGYVLVRGGTDDRITGIVTAVDLAHQFKQGAHPFLLIGEIEHHLRNLVRRKFTVEELDGASDGSKEVRGPDDLTFGGYCRLLEKPEAWAKLELNVDRKAFIDLLQSVRSVRNDIMHFTPDDHDPSDIMRLERMAQFLRKLG